LTVANYGPQDFNTLASTGTSGSLPTGWYFAETGTNSNTIYTAGNGSVNTGDTYSFGSTSSPERALGGIQSGSLIPTIGFWVTNNTGSTITSILITYTGEQWRLGTAGRSDRLDFQYSLTATNILDPGTWTDVNALDFASPVISGTVGPLDGNAAPNRVNINSIITGLTVPNGTTIFFRWNDLNATSADDGLAIDDFSLAIVPSIPASTDHYRTFQSGGWDIPATWETSATGADPWTVATLPPTSAANTITIMNGHTVSIDANTSADQLTIASGGILIYSGGTFTIDDGAGDDVDIQNGGIFTLAISGTPPTFSGAATVNVATGGILRVSAAGLTPAGAGVNAINFVYQHQSILEYTLNGAFSTTNVVFFPNVNATTIPIFRTTANLPTVMLLGGSQPTKFNGIFECAGTATIRWQNSGDKIFRNGIRGAGKITVEAATVDTCHFRINGLVAEIGGTDSLIVPATNGLVIGESTVATVTSDKIIHGLKHQ